MGLWSGVAGRELAARPCVEDGVGCFGGPFRLGPPPPVDKVADGAAAGGGLRLGDGLLPVLHGVLVPILRRGG